MRPNNDLASLIVAHLYALLSVARFIANPSETIRRVFVHRTEALFVGKPRRFVCLLRKFEGDIDVIVVRLPGMLVIPCGGLPRARDAPKSLFPIHKSDDTTRF